MKALPVTSVLWLLCCQTPLHCLAQDSPLTRDPGALEASVDSIFADWAKPLSPGGAVAVLYRDQVLLKKGYGLADLAHKTPVSPSSLFNVASMAKQFTAACIALLEEERKLSFDDDIKKYFPQFRLRQTVTIRHLLSHTSGLREGYVLAALSGKTNWKGQVRKKYKTVAHLLDLMARQQELNFKPGEEYAYTNINYILLGEIVQRASGLSLPDYAERFIFQPLGMSHTYFNAPNAPLRPNRAIPYQWTNGQKFKPKSIRNDQGVIGDNNLITSVDDLILWSRNFTQNRLGQVRPSLLQTLQTRYILNSGDTTQYAFGLTVSPYKKVLSIGHGGDDYRYTSFMVRFPHQHLAVICLSNRSVYEDTQNKVFAVADRLLNTGARSTVSPKRPISVTTEAIDLSGKTGRYLGSSAKNRYSFREVYIHNGEAYIAFRPGSKVNGFRLWPGAQQHYFFKVEEPDTYVEAWFVPNRESGAMELFERFKNDTLRFRQVPDAVLSGEELGGYSGKYRSEEVDGQLRIKSRNSGLTLCRGLIKINMISVGKDVFYAPENRALFHFGRNEAGSVIDFRINASDFRNIKYRK